MTIYQSGCLERTIQRLKKGNVKMRAMIAQYREYWVAGVHAFGDILRRITDALLGRPNVAPVPVRVRRD